MREHSGFHLGPGLEDPMCLLSTKLGACPSISFSRHPGERGTQADLLDSGFRRYDAMAPCETFMVRSNPATGRGHGRSPG